MSRQMMRYEYKYLISEQSAVLLRCQLAALLSTDEHSNGDGRYFIRSVYFDDADYTAYHDKLAGVNVRNKYRLRFYNMDSRYIFFEAKRKRGQRMVKNSVVVSRDCAERMMSGGRLRSGELEHPLLREFDAFSLTGGLTPSVIVDYDRAAFTHPMSDTRITLDSDVRAETYRPENVFVRHASAPVLEDGMVILEVKFNEELPPFLAQWLSGVPKILCANSKYCNCLEIYF
jgi:hypothetical protein